jgi:hypothetical protein
MGRCFLSLRQGVHRIADRWERASSVRYRRGWGVVQIAGGIRARGLWGAMG